MVSALGHSRLRCARSSRSARPVRVRRACDARRSLPRAAGLQCAALQARHDEVSKARRGRRSLRQGSRVREGEAGKSARRRIAYRKEEQQGPFVITVTPVEAGALGEPEPSAPPPKRANVPAAVLWMIGTLLSFSLMAISIRQLAGVLNLFELLMVRAVGGFVILFVVMALQPSLFRHIAL